MTIQGLVDAYEGSDASFASEVVISCAGQCYQVGPVKYDAETDRLTVECGYPCDKPDQGDKGGKPAPMAQQGGKVESKPAPK